jgi:hypothetical protein
MFKYYDRIRERTPSGGTGNLVLVSVGGNYLDFVDVFNTNTLFPYTIVDTNAYETGIGYLNGSGELVRQTVLSSTNATRSGDTVTYTAVNFSLGTTKDVFVPAPANRTPVLAASPTDNYSGSKLLTYGLNSTLNGWEWQLKNINDALIPSDGSMPNNRIIFSSGSRLATSANLLFDSNASPNTVTLTGDLIIDGRLRANAKLFSIPHPIIKGKILNHGSLEGPEFGIYYRANLTIRREAALELPDYFNILARNWNIFASAQDGSRISWHIDGGKVLFKRKFGWFKSTNLSVIVMGSRADCLFALEE